MTPTLTLVRPGDTAHEALGNDGLTDSERQAYADVYRAGVGSRVISPAALALYEARRAARGTN